MYFFLFTLIYLISCDAFETTNVLIGLFVVFAMHHLVGVSPKNNEIPPPQLEITSFTLFYSYIVLHNFVKPYKYICFTLTLFYIA